MGYDLHVCDSDGEALQTNYEDDLYFRRNIFGMGPLRDAMGEVTDGKVTMGYWARGAAPDFPTNGTEHEVMWWLKTSRDESPGIPLHKLCSNDGWWVTVPECMSALAIWERAGTPQLHEFGDDWIPFLRAAVKNGGFRTY